MINKRVFTVCLVFSLIALIFGIAPSSMADTTADRLLNCRMFGRDLSYKDLSRQSRQKIVDLIGQAQIVNFIGANLNGAVLTYVPIGGSCFYGVRASNANFESIQCSGCTFYGSTANSTNFKGVTCSNCDFYGATANGSFFQGATLDSSLFRGATMVGTHFEGAILDYSNFYGANLSNSQFQRALLYGVDFTGADLRNTNFCESYHDASTIWARADLRGAQCAPR